MNFKITSFQARIAVTIADTGGLTTYELSKKLRTNFWKVQDACRTLWVKGYVDNVVKKWSLIVDEVPEPSRNTEYNSF